MVNYKLLDELFGQFLSCHRQGYMLLACQAHFPSLHPPPCDIINHPNECTMVSGRNLRLLTLGLYVIPIGEGAVRVCAAALGGDQFDGDDPHELRGKISFFNWFAFCISLGGFVGLVFVVWAQNNEGWDLGFVLSALVALLGTVVLLAGLPFYRHQKPTGSPLTRILQVHMNRICSELANLLGFSCKSCCIIFYVCKILCYFVFQ